MCAAVLSASGDHRDTDGKESSMSDLRTLTLYHAPNTRSSATLALLEELKAPHELHVLNMKAGEQRGRAYLAVNPMGKVPAIRHGDVLVTEQVAITIYLADLYSEAGLAPSIGDRLRGPYLRWLVYYAACFEPAVVDRAAQREPASVRMSPYGDFDTVMKTLAEQLGAGPFILGDRFTAADVLWGTGLSWTIAFQLVPALTVFTDYVSRINARPGVARARARDAALAAAQEVTEAG